MSELFEQAKTIWDRAQAEAQPVFTVCLVSGGNDSKAAFYAAREIGIPIDAIVFANTRTGIPETAQHVEQWAASVNVPLLVGDAKDTYERYVLENGFIGRGREAHNFAYHLLKAGPLRKAISSVRQRRRGFRVAMITGIRLSESDNRKYFFANKTIRRDGDAPNWFVNLIENWSARDILDYIRDQRAMRNPVADILHHSRECMCGTTQPDEERQEAEQWYPDWGCWLRNLEDRVTQVWPWKWGEEMPEWFKQMRAGQMSMGDEYLPMCQACEARSMVTAK